MRVAAAGLLLTGCFYIDPIVARPEVMISASGSMERGSRISLEARFTNRDEQVGTFHWELFACASYERNAAQACDPDPWIQGETQTFTAEIPAQTRQGAVAAAASVRLSARDGIGAHVTDTNDYALADAPPVLDGPLRISGRDLTVGAPIDVFARYSDPDSALDDVALTWTATAPSTQQSVTWESPSAPSVDMAAPPHATVGRRLIPGEPGTWYVDVVATSHGKTSHASAMIDVVPNRPPCLALWQPTVPPVGAVLPISAPTLFEVLKVDDDLDAYPPLQGAAQYGAARFVWSLLRPEAPGRQVLDGSIGNQLEIDPAVFTPGDVVELRVEVFDDEHAVALPCDDGAPSCALVAGGCLQRQTWRVEIR